MILYYLVKTNVQSIMLTCASSQSKSWVWEFFVYFLIVYLVDVFNMIEAFRENGLNTLDHNTELHETRLEAIVSSIFYALNKRLPTTHYIDVERSISLVTNWLLYAYDRWDLLNCKKSSFKGTGNYSGTCSSQKRLEHKENQTKYRKMTRKPWSHVRKLIIISSVGYCMLHGQANLIFCSLRAIACMSYYSL